MKKILTFLLTITMVFTLVGCGDKKDEERVNINVNFDAFEELNKDDSIVNDLESNEEVKDVEENTESEISEEPEIVVDEKKRKSNHR